MSLSVLVIALVVVAALVGLTVLLKARQRRALAGQPGRTPQQPLFAPLAAPPTSRFSGQRQPGLLCLVTGIPPDSCTCPAHERPTR